MNILDFLALGGSIASILGVFLYFYQKTNNKLIKSIGDRMDEGFKRMDEGFKKMDEGLKMMAQLIVADGEKTRKLLDEYKKSSAAS